MIHTAVSRAGAPIRLTDERWGHIVTVHGALIGMRASMLAAISNAERVVAGRFGELLAIRTVEEGKSLVVVYRERGPSDGFVITAFIARRVAALNRRSRLWPPER